MKDISKFSFGATSAIITSLALIVGLDQVSNPKVSIIGALLLIAIADNIADSLGIHIYRESQFLGPKNSSNVFTITNFLARLAVTLVFVLLIILLPLKYAVFSSLVLGILALSLISYFIALYHKTNPYLEIFKHVGIAILVLIASHFAGQLIRNTFSNL